MNLYDSELMGKPSIKRDTCICGKLAQNDHHIVPKSRVHKSRHREIPTISLCGMGNTCGCHGKAHGAKLYFRWRDGWEWLELEEPTRREVAEEMEGWRAL